MTSTVFPTVSFLWLESSFVFSISVVSFGYVQRLGLHLAVTSPHWFVGTSTISTRRFWALPADVALSAIGLLSP
jgi:hypothetical protein